MSPQEKTASGHNSRAPNQALIESEQRLRLAIQSVTEYAICMLDPEGRIVTWSAEAKRSEDYKPEEVLGQNFSMFFLPGAAEAGVPERELAAAALDSPFETSNWRQRKGGEKFWAAVTLTAIRNSEGELQGFANVTRDMTAQRMLEGSLLLVSQLEYCVAEKTQQLEITAGELQRKNEEIANYSSVISNDRREKKVLLREVYHRVKNNLQVVESLLKMKSRSLSDATARAAIETSILRVHVMAMVHERLYQMPDLGDVSLIAYIRDLIGEAIAAHSEIPGQVELELDVEEIPLALDVAIPFGLLMNELISNCLEHGLPNGGAGKIGVSVRRTASGVRVVIKDNGVGLPDGFDAARSTSMGLTLAASLARQLGGTLEFKSSHGCQVQAHLMRLTEQINTDRRGMAQKMVKGTQTNPPHPNQCPG